MCLYYTEHPEKVKQKYFMELLDLYFSRIYNQKKIFHRKLLIKERTIMKNSVKKPDILKSELDTSATEPQEKSFKSRLEIEELDLEKVTGGAPPRCYTVR